MKQMTEAELNELMAEIRRGRLEASALRQRLDEMERQQQMVIGAQQAESFDMPQVPWTGYKGPFRVLGEGSDYLTVMGGDVRWTDGTREVVAGTNFTPGNGMWQITATGYYDPNAGSTRIDALAVGAHVLDALGTPVPYKYQYAWERVLAYVTVAGGKTTVIDQRQHGDIEAPAYSLYAGPFAPIVTGWASVGGYPPPHTYRRLSLTIKPGIIRVGQKGEFYYGEKNITVDINMTWGSQYDYLIRIPIGLYGGSGFFVAPSDEPQATTEAAITTWSDLDGTTGAPLTSPVQHDIVLIRATPDGGGSATIEIIPLQCGNIRIPAVCEIGGPYATKGNYFPTWEIDRPKLAAGTFVTDVPGIQHTTSALTQAPTPSGGGTEDWTDV